MRRLPILVLTLFMAVSLSACTTENEAGVTDSPIEQPEDNISNEEEEETMETNTIRLTVDGRSFEATLANNSSARALKERLAQGKLSIQMDDYGDMEKVGSLGFSLPRNDAPTTTAPGDLILYLGNSLVLYYDTNSWNFTRLGKVNGVSTREQMLELLGGKGTITVTLSLP